MTALFWSEMNFDKQNYLHGHFYTYLGEAPGDIMKFTKVIKLDENFYNPDFMAPCGNIFMNISDCVKYLQEYQKIFNEKSNFLSSQTIKKIMETETKSIKTPLYSYGWYIENDNISYGGYWFGTNTMFYVLKNIGMAVCTNIGTAYTGEITKKFGELFIGLGLGPGPEIVDKQNDKRIYLIRHGETDWNVEGRSQGSEEDIVLNSTGKKQAKITGLYLKNYRTKHQKFDAVFSSPMKRAYETAEIIKNELNLKDDIIDKAGQKLGYESIAEISTRCEKIIGDILLYPYQKIIKVTYSGIIDGILTYITSLSNPCMGDVDYSSNCSISYIKYVNGKFKVITNPNTLHMTL